MSAPLARIYSPNAHVSTVGGIIATVQDPNSFDSFHDSNGNFQQFLPFFETTGEGSFCINVDLASSGISGVKDGANVTLQLIFDGGDGQLYQVSKAGGNIFREHD